MAGKLTRGWGLPRSWSIALPAILIACLLLPSPAAARKARGIDVSRFQGVIDWVAVGETRQRFAFVQASRGSGRDCLVAPTECGPDQYYPRNYTGAKAVGLRAGAYHRAFASGSSRRKARRDARREAKVFLGAVGEVVRGDLLPVLDLESPFVDLNANRLRLWIRVWLRRVEKATGVKPMIYTNHSSWQATGDTQEFALEGHRLWVANFGVPGPLVPALDWADLGWSVWQHTSTGRVRGVSGNVDKNKLAVRLRELVARPGEEEPEPGPEPEPEPPVFR